MHFFVTNNASYNPSPALFVDMMFLLKEKKWSTLEAFESHNENELVSKALENRFFFLQ